MLSKLALPNRALVAALTLAAIADRADAAGGLILVDKPPAEDYTLAIGPGVAGYPQTPGSSRTKVLAVPGVDFYSSLGAFAATDTGIGWNFSHRADLQGGVRLWPVFGRSGSRSRERGLPDVGTRLGEGLFLNYAPLPSMTLQSGALAGSAYQRDGVQVEGGATVGAPIGDRVLLGLTLGATWANGPHLRSYYGVNPQASAAGGLPVYTPSSGWLDVNAQLNGELRIAERWKVSGQVVGARLVGDAGRSPVTQSRNQTIFSLTLWYQLK